MLKALDDGRDRKVGPTVRWAYRPPTGRQLRRMIPVAALTATTLLLAGCAASKVDPGASVNLHGTLTHPDGTAAAGVGVGLLRAPDPLEMLTVGLTAGTELLSCLSHNGAPICRTVQYTRTDAHGRYRYRMRGSDVRGDLGEASPFELSAALPAGRGEVAGPSFQSGFEIQRTTVAMPTVTFWHPPTLSASSSGRRVTVQWSAFDVPGADRPDRYLAQFTESRGATIWSQPARSGATVDARALEDTGASFHADAAVPTKGPDTTFDSVYSSQSVRSHGGAGAPESRGADCYVRAGGKSVRLKQCPLTDGKFNASFPAQGCAGQPSASPGASAAPCRANSSLYVDLGSPQPVGTVFAHGLSGAVVLDTSDDAVHWTRRTDVGSKEFDTITLHQPVSARYVRLRNPDGMAIRSLTELSVWPDR